MYVCAQSFNQVWLFASAWTVACQASLSMEFSKQEYWSGLLFPSPGDLPDPGIKPAPLRLLPWRADSSPLAPPGKPLVYIYFLKEWGSIMFHVAVSWHSKWCMMSDPGLSYQKESLSRFLFWFKNNTTSWKNRSMCMYSWVPSLFTWYHHKIVNRLYFNRKSNA